ncbi:AI-2E family transporter [Sphingobium ummariense]|uniref:Permease n=1 Tax=Sphingobium ummariense RL-3 TaxID=1346791 RepID=T0K8I9_9SPHN|nr:AI-2E family transporter [Sphingobium ummariense]EQB32999.1 hypothetical protein M529_06545 [Sphingobium ummariense RL-3]
MTHETQGSGQMEDGVFVVLVIIISLAFALVVEPFFGAILWAIIAAILFMPLNKWMLAALGGRKSGAALLTLLVIIALVIIPSILLAGALIQEATVVYGKLQSGQINIARMFADFQSSLPDWASRGLRRLGITNFNAAQRMLTTGITASFRTLAAQAFQIGQSAFGFFMALGVMLYLAFFLLRDGERLVERIEGAAPLRAHHRRALVRQFVVVVRATIKGSVVVAIVQGIIGGFAFWALGIPGALLWGVLMGFFSLIPAIGTGLVWVPVSIYLIATGSTTQGLILAFTGFFIISMVDNVLRPILVGRDTRIPDYVVLITTLGGLELFGFNGIVIGPVIAALFIATWNIVANMRAPGGIEGPLTGTGE